MDEFLNSLKEDKNTAGFKISALPTAELDSLHPLLDQSPYKPLRYLGNEFSEHLDWFWLESIARSAQDNETTIRVARQGGNIIGALVLADNPWETRVLGEKAGTISHFIVNESSPLKEQAAAQLLDQTVKHALIQGVRLLLCKSQTDATTIIHALERRGFLLMDTLIDCHYDFRAFPFEQVKPPSLSPDVTIRLAGKEDEQELVSVARAAFQHHFGRYHADERIGSERAARFYEEWSRSSLNGYADWVCIAEIDRRIAGYSIWKKPSPLEARLPIRVGHYSIGGIHPDYFGRGLFTILTYEGMKLLRDFADVIEGPTHVNNYGVQLGYSKLHWRICSDARHSFHKWI